jgi:hypothetical protein
MDMNEYTLEVITRARLHEMRMAAEREGLARSSRSSAWSLRLALGRALVRLGHRLLQRPGLPPEEAGGRGSVGPTDIALGGAARRA